jgi:molybdopterin molybdotransferase
MPNPAMITVDEARARILAGLRPMPAEIVAVANAWNRVTAEPVIARLTQPPSDVSAMDGYALRAIDGGLHASLRVIGAAPAGHPFDGAIGSGQTVRLFTGSVVPSGADAILLQEDAERSGDTVTVTEAVVAGRHIRRAGQDFSKGDTVIAAGRRMTARDVGLAAAANHPWLTVHRRPRVAILATGDEIALPGEPIPTPVGSSVPIRTRWLLWCARLAVSRRCYRWPRTPPRRSPPWPIRLAGSICWSPRGARRLAITIW